MVSPTGPASPGQRYETRTERNEGQGERGAAAVGGDSELFESARPGPGIREAGPAGGLENFPLRPGRRPGGIAALPFYLAAGAVIADGRPFVLLLGKECLDGGVYAFHYALVMQLMTAHPFAAENDTSF